MFKKFKVAVQKRFQQLAKYDLFYVDIDKDAMWNAYMDAFPEGTNRIYKERREYDCQACRQFIKRVGHVVAIFDGQKQTIWDVEVEGYYQVVADALDRLIKSQDIVNVFVNDATKVGVNKNHQEAESGSILIWEHFFFKLPEKFVKSKDDIGGYLSETRSRFDVLKRSLKEISVYAAETVLELIDQNSLYRGEEHKPIIELFIEYKKCYDKLIDDDLREILCWQSSIRLGGASKIRNTVIGTLLSDISEGKGLDESVRDFESKVAPANYKRPKAIVTKGMIRKAQDKVEELGIERSLSRRHAVLSDVKINNVLFADRTARKAMNVFDEMIASTPEKPQSFKKVEEIGIEDFIQNILPKIDEMSVFVENGHTGNLVSLVSPEHSDAPNILKWDNNFSWTYNGEVTDSMKERVKGLGGNVDAVLRFSIQWNEDGDNNDDFDALCVEPNRNLIYYATQGRIHPSSGMLDVDIMEPFNDPRCKNGPAVENITWRNKTRMMNGRYIFLVHNYSYRGGKSGFSAEIEYEGKTYSYVYNKPLRQSAKVVVAEIDFSHTDGVKFIKSLPDNQSSKNIWNITTQNFVPVDTLMYSPNHWDGQGVGNRHFFFILNGCRSEKPVRGFFNEFLKQELHDHRKVFEVLGSKMMVPESENQLSGVGFSSTKRNHLLCKVRGSFTRALKIIF